jgi:hypothetical protein
LYKQSSIHRTYEIKALVHAAFAVETVVVVVLAGAAIVV